MTHARTQHPNAMLTPNGRRRMVRCVLEQGWAIEATAERFQVNAKTVRKWRDRSSKQATLACVIGRRVLADHRTGLHGRVDVW